MIQWTVSYDYAITTQASEQLTRSLRLPGLMCYWDTCPTLEGNSPLRRKAPGGGHTKEGGVEIDRQGCTNKETPLQQ